MRLAAREAKKAENSGEVPVGCVLVNAKNGLVIARGRNQKEARRDPTAHAEIIAIRRACRKLKNWRLPDVVLYSTIEPCVMCAGAIIQARIPEVVFGIRDARFGGIFSLAKLHRAKQANHRFEVTEGVLKKEILDAFRNFFRAKRKN